MRDDLPLCSFRPGRRQFLGFGAYAALASALHGSRASSAETGNTRPLAAAKTGARPIRSCILLIFYGGPSHLDTWDPKPEAPAEVRGEFQAIATNVPGRFVSEHLPRMAQVIDKLAVVRSMHHPMTDHNAAMYEVLVGRDPFGGNAPVVTDRKNDFPSHGSALSYLVEHGQGLRANALTHVALPHVMTNAGPPLPGQTAGFLGPGFDPLQITQDPNLPDFRVDELTLPAELPGARFDDRLRLLERLRLPDQAVGDTAFVAYRDRVVELLRNERLQAALAIGRHKLGQSLLLARRLVEAGTSFVNVNDKVVNAQTENWDSHENCFGRHKHDLLPPADQALSALIEDLDQRGLLESTLVVAMGEFGRAPKINAKAGRDHWPNCYSVVLAGGGVSGGLAYGASDRLGAYPDTPPVTPGDLAATIFWRFGLDIRQEIHDPLGRPHRLATGEPILGVFS